MSLRNSSTSNPIFNDYFWDDGRDSSKKMTVFGVFIKSLFGILVIAAITSYIWKLSTEGWDTGWFTLGGMLSSIVISIIISVRTQWAGFLVPLYIIAKGFFLCSICQMRV